MADEVEEEEIPDIKSDGDPVDFIFSNSKYHDCHLTVGNPDIDEVEKIGVSSTQLIAHSSVFREMLADSELADPSGANTHIKDVSPATFKLMLRHVYGGKLPKKRTAEEAAELAFCADKYNIQRLVGKAAKRLKPTTVEDFFPALKVVTYMECPDLEMEVTKMIQQKTDEIVQDPNFLEIDENQILHIVKQDTLRISELELWNNIVRWAENQVKKHPEKTVRECLQNVLQHTRLLLLSVEEIAKHVLPTKILSPEEFVEFISAVTNNDVLQMPGFCNIQEKRAIYKEIQSFSFIPDSACESSCKNYSTLTLKPTKRLEISSFKCKTAYTRPQNDDSYSYIDVSCYITLYASSNNGLLTITENFSVNCRTLPNKLITLPVKRSNGDCLILEAKNEYTLKICASPPLTTHKFRYSIPATYDDGNGMIVTFEDPFHILEIAYKVIE